MSVERRRGIVKPAVDLRVAFLPRPDVRLCSRELAVCVVMIRLSRLVVGCLLMQQSARYRQLTAIFRRPGNNCRSNSNGCTIAMREKS